MSAVENAGLVLSILLLFRLYCQSAIWSAMLVCRQSRVVISHDIVSFGYGN